MPVKITLIGAGSGMFAVNLVKDICLTPNLNGATICLMDINEEKLTAIHALCQRYAEETGIALNIQKTMSREEALTGADFVINTALAAGHHRLKEGWGIARKYGYRFGGSLHIMHDEAFWINFYQFRLMEDIVKDMLRICPDAWYLLVANPVVTGVTYLKRKYPQAKIVGMCHGYGAVYWLADRLGLERSKISYEICGVNHFVFLNRFYYEGQDAYPILDRWVSQESQKHFESCGTSAFEGPKAVDLYKRFGKFPIGDTATPGGGSWPWWYHSDDETEAAWKEDPEEGFEGYFWWVQSQVDKVRQYAFDSSVKVTEIFSKDLSGEPMIPLIEAIACGVERTVMVNILNDGEFIPGIPKDFQVEIPALCSAKGVQGIRTAELPKHILAMLYRDKIAPCEMELAAFETGSKEMLHALLMMDPYTKNEKQARDFLEELLALPYHAGMRAHYR